jgi:UDP-GlcNAc:undecaprenyl-phosphate GlcNAc-1-phosphate transferase
VAAAVCVGLLPLIRRLSLRRGWVAKPREERWHKRLVTKFGGVAIWAGVLVAAVAFAPHTAKVWAFLAGTTALFGLGLLDDFIGVKPYSKVLGQIVVACGLLFAGVGVEIIPWTWLAILVTIGWVVCWPMPSICSTTWTVWRQGWSRLPPRRWRCTGGGPAPPTSSYSQSR